MNPDMQDWERNYGVQFLESIGLKPGHSVVDFGSNVGHYAIPAAKIVGSTGTIYALDVDEKALKMIRNKARIHMLKNIELEKTNGRPVLEFGESTIDFIFLYDLFHIMDENSRSKLFKEVRRILKPEGIMSVFPKHLDDNQSEESQQFSLKNLKDEIESFEFILIEERTDIICQNHKLVEGIILNYMNNF